MAYDYLGPHMLYAAGPGMQWASQARIVKQADGGHAALAAASGSATTIWRSWNLEGVWGGNWNSGAACAQWVLGQLGGFRPDYVEGLNEVGYTESAGLGGYLNWLSAYTAVMHANGIKVAGFSFPVGWPRLGPMESPAGPDDWAMIVNANFGGVDAISLHEYWGKPGLDHMQGWWHLRYRKSHQRLVDLGRGNHPPFLITECGRDNMDNLVCQAPCPGGWLNQGVSAGQFLSELSWYNDRIKETSSYVLGATPFTCAADSSWSSFQMDSLVGDLMSGGGGGECNGRPRCWDGSCPDGSGNCPEQPCNIPAPAGGCGPGYYWDSRPGICRCEPCVQTACDPGYHWEQDLCQCWEDGKPKPTNTGLVLVGAGLLAAAMLALAYRTREPDDYGEAPPSDYRPVSEVLEMDADVPPPPGYFRIEG